MPSRREGVSLIDMTDRKRITISVAGLRFGLPPSDPGFFKGFLADAPPEIILSPTRADAELARRELRLANGAEPSPALVGNAALHCCLAEALPARGRMLMHGSALSHKGRAVIFTAPSGTGKSTHSRYWREAFGGDVTMIDDDKPILRFDGNGVFACGTPWNGKHRLGSNGSARLHAIAKLERGEPNVEPLPPGEAFELMLDQGYRPQSAEAMRLTFELIEELIARVPFYRVTADMSARAALVSREGIFHEKEV